MNFIEMTGGLGNQMFQYTFSKYIESITNTPCVLYMNYFDYASSDPSIYVSRAFDLNKFNTNFISVKGSVNYSILVDDNSFSPNNIPQNLVFFKGYWQDKSFYTEISSIIKNDFALNSEYITPNMVAITEEMAKYESVSLHVRRTDYLLGNNSNLFSSLNYSYYEKALTILEDYTGKDLCVYVFSDDIQYVKENFRFLNQYNVTFMPCTTAYQDMYLMCNTKHHIIANSSYSWWGAALTNSPDGFTFAPSSWYKDTTAPNLILDNWICI